MFAQAQFLSQEEQQIIHNESIRILEEVGALFHSQKALNILEKNGAKVDWKSNIAKISAELDAEHNHSYYELYSF
jgi:trimethylamine--corrinoid protein Co-methyltransferase